MHGVSAEIKLADVCEQSIPGCWLGERRNSSSLKRHETRARQLDSFPVSLRENGEAASARVRKEKAEHDLS